MPGYYIGVGAAITGPFTFEQLDAQTVIGGTPVWREGLPDWVYARELPELRRIVAKTASRPAILSTIRPQSRRVLAALVTLVAVVAVVIAKHLTIGEQSPPSRGLERAESLPAAFAERQIRLPILTVRGDVGVVVDADFRVSRTVDTSTPLLVSVEEDTPSGAGPVIRASVWMAAVVAGLHQLDDLAGVRLAVRLPGHIDGPSAGAIVCLALLTELNGQAWPADVAITGAVLPDGTIAPVGGVRHKLAAASASGKRRVLVPALTPSERDDSTGREINLKAIAGSLNLTLIPVRDVTDAYRALHELKANPIPQPPLAVLALPPDVDEYLLYGYRADLAEADRLLTAMSPERRAAAERDQFLGPMLRGRAAAGRAFTAGRNYVAAEKARGILLAARVAATYIGNDLPAAGDTAETIMDRSARDLPVLLGPQLIDPRQLLSAARAPVTNPAGAQFCASVCELVALVTNLGELRDRTIAQLAAEGDPAQRARIASTLGGYERRIATVLKALADALPTEVGELSEFVAKVEPPEAHRARTVERFFYGACLAAGSAAEADLNAAANELGIAPGDLLGAMATLDDGARTRMALPALATHLHESLPAEPSATADDAVLYAAVAHIHADCLAQITANATRWQAFGYGPGRGGGASRYARADALGPAADAARAAAVISIADCHRRGIPCVRPVMLVQRADQSRADGQDLVEVLTSYVRASVQAKALVMLSR